MIDQHVYDAVLDLTDRFPLRHLADRPQDATDRYIKLYCEDLSDLPSEIVVAAINKVRQTSTFMPAVAEIRRTAVEMAVHIETVEEAEKLIREQMRTRMPGDGKGPWQIPPLVMEVVQDIGTANLRSDEGGHQTRRFRELYAERRKDLIDNLVGGIIPLNPGLTPELVATSVPMDLNGIGAGA